MNAPITTTGTDVPIVEYGHTEEELRAALAKYADAQFNTPAEYREGTKAIAVCRSLRGELEAKRKALKAGALEYGRQVDSVAKALTAVVESVEEPLKLRKAAIDEVKEAEKRAKEEAERAAVEARLRAEQEAKARAERERIAAEEAAVREAERQAELARRLEALRPERERVTAYLRSLLDVPTPETTNELLTGIVRVVRESIGEGLRLSSAK
jgi:chromosome segregation ATPase